MPRFGKKLSLCVGAALGIAALLPSRSGADVFVLRSGGRLSGQLLNPDESPRMKFLIQVPGRGVVTLSRSDVKGIEYRSPEVEQYETLRHKIPDTVAGHTQLAAWCLDHSLLDERRGHLERVIELDPHDEAARIALGYREVNGQWMTRDAETAARGLVLYEGRYRLQQEIDLLKQESSRDQAERQWYTKIKRWYDWLGSRKHPLAIEGFQSINDPHAAPALVKFLAPEKGAEPVREVKLLLMEVLARLDSGEALGALVDRSLNDADVEVRLSAMDHLTASKSAGISGRFAASLHSKDNRIVNRAAAALRVLEDESVVPALIDALITEHKFLIQKGGSGQMSASFNRNGGPGGGMSFGGEGPKIIKRKLANADVLTTLVSLTGVNYQYDQKAWKAWLRSRNKVESIDIRRD